jgi:hypothetical protein
MLSSMRKFDALILGIMCICKGFHRRSILCLNKSKSGVPVASKRYLEKNNTSFASYTQFGIACCLLKATSRRFLLSLNCGKFLWCSFPTGDIDAAKK